MRLLLGNGSSVNSQDGEGYTPLHRAAQSGYLDIVTLLLESDADVNISNSNNRTPLDLAIDSRELDSAKYLAERMGSADSQDRIYLASFDTASRDSLPMVATPLFGCEGIPDEMGGSLHEASEAGHLEIVRSLIESGADVNERDKYHWTPLRWASMKGRFEVAKFLIEYGADVNIPDATGWTPLHVAARDGHVDVVHLLLNHGADVNAKKQNQWSALHLALLCDDSESAFEIVKALLEQGANVHVRNDKGQTPFQMASRRRYRDIMRLLSQYGAGGV